MGDQLEELGNFGLKGKGLFLHEDEEKLEDCTLADAPEVAYFQPLASQPHWFLRQRGQIDGNTACNG